MTYKKFLKLISKVNNKYGTKLDQITLWNGEYEILLDDIVWNEKLSNFHAVPGESIDLIVVIDTPAGNIHVINGGQHYDL
jgi:hypothetical protein